MLKMCVVKCVIGILLMKICVCDDFRRHPNWPKHLERICGENSDDRISGGHETRLGQFPWMARIVVNVTQEDGKVSNYINCGGSLVTQKHVISAEHCVEEYKADIVILGEWNNKQDPDCEDDFCADPIVKIKVRASFHPSNYGWQKRHDILLILLEEPVTFTEWITPICLPTGLDKFGTYGEVAGWGNTGIQKSSQILKYVKLPITSIKYCEKIIGIKFDESIQICAGDLTIDDACQGDSGGPFMQIANSEFGPKYYLTGIVSMGPMECGVGLGVYTKITAHMTAILDALV